MMGKTKFSTFFYILLLVLINVFLFSTISYSFDIYTNGNDLPLFSDGLLKVQKFSEIIFGALDLEATRWLSLVPYLPLLLVNYLFGTKVTLIILGSLISIGSFLFFSLIQQTQSQNKSNYFFSFFGAIFLNFSVGFQLIFFTASINLILFFIFIIFELNLLLSFFSKINDSKKSFGIRNIILALFLLTSLFGAFVINFWLFLINFVFIFFVLFLFYRKFNLRIFYKLFCIVFLPFLPILFFTFVPFLGSEPEILTFKNVDFNFELVNNIAYQPSWLGSSLFSPIDQSVVKVYGPWEIHLKSLSSSLFAITTLVLSIAGYFFFVLKDKRYGRMFLFLFGFVVLFFFLESSNINLFLGTTPLFYRYTVELFFPISFSLVIFELFKAIGLFLFMWILASYFLKFLKINVNGLLALSILIPIFFLITPSFRGEIYNNKFTLKLPPEYKEAGEFLQNSYSNKKFLVFPIDTTKNFSTYSWGYSGIGIFNFIYPVQLINQFSFTDISNYKEFLRKLDTLLLSPNLVREFMALNQIDGIIWDFNKLVNEDIRNYFSSFVKPALDSQLIIRRNFGDSLVIYSL